MRIDIRGKINEKKLAYNHTLLPLYEAIVNSIHAIEEDSATKPGIISITLIRSAQPELKFGTLTKEPPIVDFIIRDNGVGFTDSNYESFNFAHSTYKEKKGGKGIGRFVWLRAFQKAEIESRFKEKDIWQLRKFNFEPTKNGIESYSLEKVNGNEERYTEVRLKNIKGEYQKWCNVDRDDIAIKIIEHCFIYFLKPDCPRIILIDGKKELLVNDKFRSFTKGLVNSIAIKIREESFTTHIVKIYNPRIDNKIHYCAHFREVEIDRLSQDIPELDTLLTDEENDQQFSIAVYVTGNYLDKHVNEERTTIHFFKKGENDLLVPNEVTQEELRSLVAEKVKEEFSNYLGELSNIRFKKIEQAIYKHPQYRQLLKYKKDELRKIPTNLPEEKMEVELFKIQQGLDLEVKKDAGEILKFINNPDDKKEFKANFTDLYNKIIEVGNSKLSEYIIHRKLVLELLEKHIKQSNNGRFSKETIVHQLIFPLKKLSDDVGFEDHNLWVIDERLAYHKYLASDKPFKQIPEIDSGSTDRPDILIFNTPFAFANDEKPYTSIVLIEFKRPMRDDYTETENPIAQINRYAGEITENNVLDKNSRTLDFRSQTPIYAYIVSDLTKNLRKFAKDAGFKPLPDNDGFFSFNDNYNLYIEIISFDKLIRDSKQRNKVLFEKLNLPSV
ncbi:hypothetical protein MRBLMN1_002382 [Chitinophaga ginsengisegetis]|uniref:hypothetical protein n=1 Tax=Chitinophaga ginsengisegetis TaxID=393003 RepID=UPI0034238E44